MKVDKELLREYLLYRTLISDNKYNIKKILSYNMIKNVMGENAINISMEFSYNDEKEIYSDSVTVHYNTYMNFLSRKRKDKINKIINKTKEIR